MASQGLKQEEEMISATPSPLETRALDNVLRTLNDRIFEVVFEEAGIQDIHDFMTVDIDDLKGIEVTDSDGKAYKLNIVKLNKLKRVKDWYRAQGTAVVHTWMQLDQDALKEFILDQAGGSTDTPMKPPQMSTPLTTGAAVKSTTVAPGTTTYTSSSPTPGFSPCDFT